MPKRTDANQAEIVKALRDAGASVQCLHAVGKGCPDLLVGWKGFNVLFEVKSRMGTLTPDEREWHSNWEGQVNVVRTWEEALGVVCDITHTSYTLSPARAKSGKNAILFR